MDSVVEFANKYVDVNALYKRYFDAFGMEMSEATLLNDYTHSLPIGACIVYLLMVFFLPKILQPKRDAPKEAPKKDASKPRERTKPKLTFISYAMALWNLFLSVLSLAMLLGVGIPFWKIMFEKGLYHGLCDVGGKVWLTKDPMLFWAYLFAISKYLELVDTLFLIVKNPERDVPFLHWYHHFTVLLFTWYSVHYRFGTGGAFLSVNAFVHTVMYFYYFLKELNFDPSIVALPITIIQISQMVAGIYFVYVWAYMKYSVQLDCTCHKPVEILASAVVMYGSYLYLFLKYFVRRYILKEIKTTKTD